MYGSTPDRPVKVLLVEDNPGDARLAQEALKESAYYTRVTVAEDGEEAMDALRRRGRFSRSPLPNLILLDLNLPKKDGQEVLAEINADDRLKGIPVMILTGTEAEADFLETHGVPPSRFFRKPIDVAGFNRAAGELERFSRDPVRIRDGGGKGGKKWWWPFGG